MSPCFSGRIGNPLQGINFSIRLRIFMSSPEKGSSKGNLPSIHLTSTRVKSGQKDFKATLLY